MVRNIAVIGSSGTIGEAFIIEYCKKYPDAVINSFSRNKKDFAQPNVINHYIDYSSEDSIKEAAEIASKNDKIDIAIVTTGILSDADSQPEKSLKDLSSEKFHKLFAANTIFPALVAKYFIPKLTKSEKSIFACLSARVGSISDNYLGGWYSYRSSKAALNMIIKNAAIETARTNKKAVIVGLHPGTVKSKLSKDYTSNIPENKLFDASYSAAKLCQVLEKLKSEDSGKCFAWDGKEVQP